MSNTTNPGERGRFSAPRKAATVLRLLRDESLELLARELGVTAATLRRLARRLPGRRPGRPEEPAGR